MDGVYDACTATFHKQSKNKAHQIASAQSYYTLLELPPPLLWIGTSIVHIVPHKFLRKSWVAGTSLLRPLAWQSLNQSSWAKGYQMSKWSMFSWTWSHRVHFWVSSSSLLCNLSVVQQRWWTNSMIAWTVGCPLISAVHMLFCKASATAPRPSTNSISMDWLSIHRSNQKTVSAPLPNWCWKHLLCFLC
jgi:hypothetical protein